MAKKKKHKKQNSSPGRDEYDLKKSLGKLNQRKSYQSSATSSGFHSDQHRPLNNVDLSQNETGGTNSLILQLNDSFNLRYDSLTENIRNVNDKISDSSDTLRKELEPKIESKLDIQWFVWTVVGLVVITGVIYALSYNDIQNAAKENSSSIKMILSDSKNSKSDINEIKSELKDVEDKQEELKYELLKLQQKR
ncbi:hypothetical protein GUB10_04540 [Salegentibacter sp. BLCTC]|uniref:hypothetical protein n=1 Tax=Salegentibacter sp. BLCTC TaxID=2697368 RepID=UPI00187B96F0|nr:hypothetical protein [Salegentibacter sp. BLCTC]MBE7639594.1 hypothetical protein [Salegentibacter sp. BLCTC]